MKYVYEGDGALMKEIAPGFNAVRLLGMSWWNSPENPNTECYQDTAPYWREDCFKKLDKAILQATNEGVWVILTARSEWGAGGHDLDKNMFQPATNEPKDLRRRFWTAWQHVIRRYKTWDRIAAWEILSEPRD